jgi:Aspartyl protease
MQPFAARIALLFALVPATLGAGGGSNLNHLLDRMRVAAGPVWNTHFVSISRVAIDGGATAVVETDGQGLRFNLHRCNGEMCTGTYFDGQRLFTVGINGTALPEGKDTQPYLRALRWLASLGFLGPDFAGTGRRIDDGGTATVAGTRYHTLFVIDSAAVPMEVFVDPQTALVRYARDVNGTDTFEYRDYRKVDGFTIPFEIRHNGSVLERYDDRTPVQPPFDPPRGLSPTFAGPAKPVPTDPAHITPVFACEIGGVALHCLLDTGNSGLSISSEVASQLDAPVVGTVDVRGLGGYSTQVVRAGPLRIGNATFPSAYYLVLNDIRKYGYDVVVGADVLGTTEVEIDTATHALTFGANQTAGGFSVPMTFQNFVPVVTVALGTLDAQLAVDTGDESNINLGFEFYSKHTDLFAVDGRREVAGVGATSYELIGRIPEVTIGDYRTGPQTIGATQTLHGTAFGHLGAGFLSQFKVVLDYSGGFLRLTPRTDGPLVHA